ncbi:protein-tyrosine sulfotransferase [Trichonephila clavata]|uniref:Protein-tyrosine sulfotransferase n=1 Tax=Trichonephila clavata TaxID=2740835 RepID=A0A8X6LMU8_TRICU|nr:protein-tyrosine sulfotransferase [Trichonephila clavata]
MKQILTDTQCLERSTDQVIKPINTEALTKWVGHIPDDVVRDMPSLAPMLIALGYDPRANPPNYGQPDSLVIKNTFDLKVNKKLWEARERQVVEKRENIWRSWLQKPRTKPESTTSVTALENSTLIETEASQANSSNLFDVRMQIVVNDSNVEHETRGF